MSYCADPCVDGSSASQHRDVALAAHVAPYLAPLERHFLTHQCLRGLCGKASLDALRVRSVPHAGAGPRVAPAL